MPGRQVLFGRPTEGQPSLATLRHELFIRQFPVEARVSGSANKMVERRTLDPMPAIELRLFKQVDDESDTTEKRKPHFCLGSMIVSVPVDQLTGHTLFAELVGAESEDRIEYLQDGATEVLCGVSMSSLFRGPDEDEGPTLFFAFPNLCVRATGRYRLRFTLSLFGPTAYSTKIAVYSPPFRILAACKYQGVHTSFGVTQRFELDLTWNTATDSTHLTSSLRKNGARVRVRKNARGAKPSHRTTADSGDSPASSTCTLKTRPSKTPVRTLAAHPPLPGPLPILHAPQPRHPSCDVVALLSMGTMDQGHSHRALSAWSSASESLVLQQQNGASVSPFGVGAGEVGFDDEAEEQPIVFDPFLADWYSDDMHILLDDNADFGCEY
ncbi:velvet factor-domain-containing protein [Mycena haematopus]|nr:velvet factor-domain-containing protein [Mycena haematopus]